jgi:hypothetical protein
MTNRRYYGSIRRRESGRWQIRYRTRDGVRVAWPETYARRADAVKVLAELERQSQVAGNWLDVAGSKVLFAAYADEWINQHPRLGPRTADVYRSLIRRHLAPALGQIPLGQLDTATVRAWRAGLLEVGVSSTMVAKSYRLLRAILNTAVTEDELIIVNPLPNQRRRRGTGHRTAGADPRPALRPRRSDARSVEGVPAAQDLRVTPLGRDHRAHPE